MYNKAVEKAKKEGKIQGDRFVWQEGDNKIRLVGEAVLHESEYQGKPTRKWLVYIIDRRDGQVKLCFMAVTIMAQIAALQNSEDWGFEDAMPYDINVMTTGAGEMGVKYNVQPTKNNSPLTDSEHAQIERLVPIEQKAELLANKQILYKNDIHSVKDISVNESDYPEAQE